MRCTRYSIAVTTPKLPPPPRRPQRRSVFCSSVARTKWPSAVTMSKASALSQARPKRRPSRPKPPPSVRPDRAGVRDGARGGRKSESGAFMVELAEQGPGLQIGACRFRFDAHALHGLQVDDEPAIAGGLAGNAVAAGAHRGEQPVLPREVDGAPHVGRARAAGDQRGLPVEHPVPHAAARVIGRIALEQEVAAAGSRRIPRSRIRAA